MVGSIGEGIVSKEGKFIQIESNIISNDELLFI